MTRIFIVLESESRSLSENWDEISRKTRKFKRFFSPKTDDLQKKVFPEIETDFLTEIGNSNVFQPKTDFLAKIVNSNAFSGRIMTCTSQLWNPISFGGEGCFQFFTKNQKHKKRAILHTSQARAPPPPGYATAFRGNLVHDFGYNRFVILQNLCLIIIQGLTN